jgi:hypothetical protein
VCQSHGCMLVVRIPLKTTLHPQAACSTGHRHAQLTKISLADLNTSRERILCVDDADSCSILPNQQASIWAPFLSVQLISEILAGAQEYALRMATYAHACTLQCISEASLVPHLDLIGRNTLGKTSRTIGFIAMHCSMYPVSTGSPVSTGVPPPKGFTEHSVRRRGQRFLLLQGFGHTSP